MHPTLTRAFKTLVAAGVLAVINLTRPDAAAAPYLGTYDWLSFYHVASLTQSATYFAGPTESWGWLAARGTDNTDDRWRQITWDNDVTLNGVYVQEFDQFSGGTIGDYEVEYSADGTSGWTAVPTTYNFTGTGAHSVNFDSTVTARALRVRFPGGTYDQGTGGNGPGVFQLLARGNYAGGIDPADPQFNALRAPGYEGMLPAITFPGEVPQENGAQQYLRDGIITGDPEGNELIQVDLGLATGGKLWNIQNVRLYAGTFYTYMPSAPSVTVSPDGVTWSPPQSMGLVNGVMTLTGMAEVGRYVRLLAPPAPWPNTYYLVHEVGVGAFPVPEPAGPCCRGGGGSVGGGASRRLRPWRCW
ncbi:MAG: F5/8 type C domain protein [Lentisphaerae bacterium ADurb.BinA184]|nr:MAG: F5/8 type C domain protein [Lentisphaerae bacterium ADurb.BinA184]